MRVYTPIKGYPSMKNDLGKYPKGSSVCNCMNVRRASRAISQYYDDTLAPSGLTITQLGVLLQVKALGNPGISELAEPFRIDRTTMNRNLKPLLEAGLIVIQVGTDARKKEVQLTDEGLSRMTHGALLWQQAQDSLEEYLGKNELKQLRAMLAKLEALVP